MSYTSTIMKSVQKYPELKIIVAQKLYTEKFNDISELAFYKAISRMAKSGEIQRISKGIYCKPKKGRFGEVLSNEKNILEFFLGEKKNKGMVIGYQLYNKYGLTTQVSKVIELYSNIPIQRVRNIRNVLAHKSNLKFNTTTIMMIELLEILQGYNNIEDLNKKNFVKYLEEVSKNYDESIVEKILQKNGYKKGTIASLRNVLDYYEVTNTLEKYLRKTSTYKAIEMEELYIGLQ